MELKEYTLDELLPYEQPTKYIVESTKYDDSYTIPVLTAGKSFILGYTNETEGIFQKERLPVIIFDDFTTASQYVNFPFKVKSSAMKILNVNTELVLPKYIYYKMQTIQINHDTHKRYWIQQYSQIRVTIPSLEIQEKVVNKIDELFSQIDEGIITLRKIKAQLDVYRQSVLNTIFSSSDSWEEYLFGDLMEVVRNGYGKKPDDKGSHRILTIGSLRMLNLDLNNYRLNENSFEDNDMIRENDLLFTRYNGSKEFVGVCAVVPKLHENYAYPDKLIKFRPKINDKDYSKYLAYYASGGKGRIYLRSKIKTTSGQNGIAGNDIKKMKIRVPDLDTIRKIVYEIETKLSACDNIEHTIDTLIMQSESIKLSILRKEFEGGVK